MTQDSVALGRDLRDQGRSSGTSKARVACCRAFVSDALEASDPAFLINDVVDILNLERFEERYNRSFTTCTTRDSSI